VQIRTTPSQVQKNRHHFPGYLVLQGKVAQGRLLWIEDQTIGLYRTAVRCTGWVDTIRYEMLFNVHSKLIYVSLIYRTEPTTKRGKGRTKK